MQGTVARGEIAWTESALKTVSPMRGSASKPKANGRKRQDGLIFAFLTKASLLELMPEINLDRFDFTWHNPVSLLMARHGIDVLDLGLRFTEVDFGAAVEALIRVRSPRVAGVMAEAFVRRKKLKAIATEWILSHPEAATIGLLPAALGKRGKEREVAETTLRFLARSHRADILEAAKRYGPEPLRATEARLDFDPLMALPSKLPAMPVFWNPASFTPPLLKTNKKAIPVEAVDALGVMLSFSSLDNPYQGIADVKEACESRSLAKLSWEIFQAWLIAGAPSKEQWAFLALAHFGDDDTARHLTPLIRAWPGESAHARAVVGLEVLAGIGTDVALMHLHGMSQKLQFKALQEKAREKIAQIAERRGLTADELGDRLVPDLGLDDDGSRTLDFGPRHFRVSFDESLKPIVRDEADKALNDLPKAKQSDDAEKAKEATQTWKTLKKDAKVIASSQIVRLELAMCAERRWAPEVFRQFMVDHPVVTHLVKRLLWSAHDADGGIVRTFRVVEDRTFADVSDETITLEDAVDVRVVHRLELSDVDARAWGQIFADYKILQPFPQLSREVVLATETEKQGTTIDRVKGLLVPTGKVLALDQRGWRRGPPEDGGIVGCYEKPVGNERVVRLDLDPGIYTGAIAESPEQKLGTVSLDETFGTLTPIALSELLRDLESLTNASPRTI